MTKEDWKQLEDQYGLFNPIHLMCDGYKITLKQEAGKNKLYNMVYVNDVFKGTWTILGNNHSESKFMYETNKTYNKTSPKELRKLQRLLGKERAKIFEPKTFISLNFFYPSFTAFKRQMMRKCTNIEIFNES